MGLHKMKQVQRKCRIKQRESTRNIILTFHLLFEWFWRGGEREFYFLKDIECSGRRGGGAGADPWRKTKRKDFQKKAQCRLHRIFTRS
jgi:hypothetical protein